MCKEYWKAVRTYDLAAKIAQQEGVEVSQELAEAKAKTMRIHNEQMMTGKIDPERRQRAMADPEIQGLLQDTQVSNLLTRARTNPACIQQALRTPAIAEKINTLILAGVL